MISCLSWSADWTHLGGAFVPCDVSLKGWDIQCPLQLPHVPDHLVETAGELDSSETLEGWASPFLHVVHGLILSTGCCLSLQSPPNRATSLFTG